MAVNKTIDTAPVINSSAYRDILAEIEEYDSLTIGNSRDHVKALKRAVGLGGGSVLALTIAQPPEYRPHIDWSNDADHPQLPL